MLYRFSIQLHHTLAGATCLMAVALTGCAVHLPPAPVSDPAAANAPEGAAAPLRPGLVASSRYFLSPHAENREQKAKQMDAGGMKAGEMAGIAQHGEEMSKMPPASAAAGAAYFTCPMHPDVHEDRPGECPKCGMTLVKKGG
jgi:hypothetical protein